MKNLIVAALMLLLCACTGTSQQQTPLSGIAAATGGIASFATLAPVGSFEWDLAPSYTQMSMLRQRASTRLREKRLSKDVVVAVLQGTDAVRSLLDEAKDLERAGHKDVALSNLESAKHQLVSIEADIERGTQ